MITAPLPARIAVEMWTASGERSKSRLHFLVEHFANQYNLAAELDALKEQALALIPPHMRPEA